MRPSWAEGPATMTALAAARSAAAPPAARARRSRGRAQTRSRMQALAAAAADFEAAEWGWAEPAWAPEGAGARGEAAAEATAAIFDAVDIVAALEVAAEADDEVDLTLDEYTYGEFDRAAFGAVVERLQTVHGARGGAFVDVGCGRGQLVLAAAEIAADWRDCVGVEFVPELAAIGMAACQIAGRANAAEARTRVKPRVLQGDAFVCLDDLLPPLPQQQQARDVWFCYATRMRRVAPEQGSHLQLSMPLRRAMAEGALAAIVNATLDTGGGFEEVEELHCQNRPEQQECVVRVYRAV